MILDFIVNLLNRFEGNWYGKGVIISNTNGKITSEKVLNKVHIKKINEFTYDVRILALVGKTKSEIKLLGFVNKETNILEIAANNQRVLNGQSQYYFNNGCLINSFSVIDSEVLKSGTVKLHPYKKPCPPKPSSSSSSSSTSSSSSSSSTCHKRPHCKPKPHCHKKKHHHHHNHHCK